MRLISGGRTAALLILALALLGCAMASERSMKETRSGTGSNQNQFCSWTFDRAPSGKVIPDSMRVTNKPGGTCTVVQSGNKLFIGDAPDNGKEILDIGAVEFFTKGSCRYCYLNSFGGMTCISYRGC